MPIAINSDFTGVAAPEVIVPPPPTVPTVAAPTPQAPAPAPIPQTPAITQPIATASGAVDEAPRGLPQLGVAPEDLGPIVAPHPQPQPASPGSTPGGTPKAPTVGTEETDGQGTAQFDPDDPAFAGFEYLGYFGEGDGSAESTGGPKILRGWYFVRSLQAHCNAYGIDTLAAIANAEAEGLGGGIGDSGHAFGPWQIWALDGRLPQFVGQPLYSPLVQAWMWTDNGIEYAVRSMKAGGASGLTGHAAVQRIVTGFERPADISGAIRIRTANYDQLRGWGASVYDHVAAMAQGPSLGQSGPTVARTTPDPTPTPVVQVGESWRGLMKTLGSDMRFAAHHASVTANEIAKGVRN